MSRETVLAPPRAATPHAGDANRPVTVYAPGAAVWILRPDGEHPGVVLLASPTAATIRYRPGLPRATAVDTVATDRIRARHTLDVVDLPMARSGDGHRAS